MNRILAIALFAAALIGSAGEARAVLFSLDNGPYQSSLPATLSSGGIDATFTATGGGYSFQLANVLGATPAQFSGLVLFPSDVYGSDLKVSFSQPLSDFSILFAPQEVGCNSGSRLKVTAYSGTTLVGSNTADAQPPFDWWPTGTLSYSSAQPFDNVVVHFEAGPSGENWGPIFMADNMNVTAAPTPEPAAIMLLVSGGAVALFWQVRRRRIAVRR